MGGASLSMIPTKLMQVGKLFGETNLTAGSNKLNEVTESAIQTRDMMRMCDHASYVYSCIQQLS